MKPFYVLILACFNLISCSGQFNNKEESPQEDSSSIVQKPLTEGISLDSDSLYIELEEKIFNYRTVQILKKYGNTIRKYSKRYSFDWRFVLAVIKQESRFIENARSHKGARVLMQVMPRTAEDLSKELKITDIYHPVNNIKAGIYYLFKLRRSFPVDKGEHTKHFVLGAYNAGRGHIVDAQRFGAFYAKNPHRWETVEFTLPRLIPEYKDAHRYTWAEGKPLHGYFYGSRETLNYVRNTLKFYNEYQQVLQRNQFYHIPSIWSVKKTQAGKAK